MRYCRFPRAALRTLLDDFPLMEKRLLEVASNELVAAQEQMLLLGRKTARERLASFLLAQSRQGMPCGHSRQRFRLPMTRIDIADYLGLTIETVSRTLTRLCAEGLIDIGVAERAGDLRPCRAGEPGERDVLPRLGCERPSTATSSNPMPAGVRGSFTRPRGDRVLRRTGADRCDSDQPGRYAQDSAKMDGRDTDERSLQSRPTGPGSAGRRQRQLVRAPMTCSVLCTGSGVADTCPRNGWSKMKTRLISSASPAPTPPSDMARRGSTNAE